MISITGNLKILLVMFFAIPLIAIFDYILFRKYTACEKCGNKQSNWYSYLIPTVIESLFFFTGITIGILINLN